MTVSPESDPSLVTVLLGGAITILAGLFGFTHLRLSQVQADMQKDIDTVRGEIDSRSGEHRQGQQQLWSELRLAEIRATEHRQRLQERIGELPTRNEMKQDLNEVKQDLVAMEKRIGNMLRMPHDRLNEAMK